MGGLPRIGVYASFACAALLTFVAPAQGAPRVQHGTWTATDGPTRVFRGTWSAEILSATTDTIRGSWTLLDAGNHIVLQGTWSMTRSGGAWQGTWSARVLTGDPSSGRSVSGRLFSGTWQAAMEDSKGTTLSEMFQRSLGHQIAGSWRTGQRKGNWWLKGSP